MEKIFHPTSKSLIKKQWSTFFIIIVMIIAIFTLKFSNEKSFNLVDFISQEYPLILLSVLAFSLPFISSKLFYLQFTDTKIILFSLPHLRQIEYSQINSVTIEEKFSKNVITVCYQQRNNLLNIDPEDYSTTLEEMLFCFPAEIRNKIC